MLLNTQNKKTSFSGFTLVELIVVITILVILGTIAFISLAGFSGSARDSSRVADLTNLSKGLEISFVKSSMYPAPDNAFAVTYSGGVLWNQGTIGASVTNIISSMGAKMNKKPTDPLDVAKEYTYSILAFWNGYQIKTDYEADSITRSNFIEKASAVSGNPAISYLKGNYKGIVAKTQTGNTLYVIATPSITTSHIGAAGSKVDIMTTLTNKFLVHGSTNSGGIVYAARLVFSATLLPNTDTDRITLASNVANAYSGTNLASQPNISPYINALVSNNTGALALLGKGLTNSIWGSPTSDPQAISSINPFVSCTAAGQTYAAATTYPGSTGFPGACDEADRILCTGNGTGQIWSMCNVGASTTSNYNSNANDRSALTNVDGKLFQFARNDGFTYGTNPAVYAGSAVATSTFAWEVATNWYYAGIASNDDWRITQLSTATDPGANIWTSSPCDANYHVPTQNEFQSAYNAFANANYGNVLNLPTVLKMPLSGLRNYPTAVLDYPGMIWYYWSSSPSATNSYSLSFHSSSVDLSYESRAAGYSVRCIKN